MQRGDRPLARSFNRKQTRSTGPTPPAKPPRQHRLEAERRRPRPSSNTVRLFMQRLRTKDTAPELALRQLLHKKGLRFRLHRRDVPGSPDIAFPAARVAVFVDGCFWHLCPQHAVWPKTNAAWWKAKLRSTRSRDRRIDSELKRLGWASLRVWEHEQPARAAARVQKLVRARMALTASTPNHRKAGKL